MKEGNSGKPLNSSLILPSGSMPSADPVPLVSVLWVGTQLLRMDVTESQIVRMGPQSPQVLLALERINQHIRSYCQGLRTWWDGSGKSLHDLAAEECRLANELDKILPPLPPLGGSELDSLEIPNSASARTIKPSVN